MNKIQAIICLAIGIIMVLIAVTHLTMDKYRFRAMKYWAAIDERVKKWMTLSDELAAEAISDATLEDWKKTARDFSTAGSQMERAAAASRAPVLFEALILPENEQVREKTLRREELEKTLRSDLADYNGSARKLNGCLERLIIGPVGRLLGFKKLPELILSTEWKSVETEN